MTRSETRCGQCGSLIPDESPSALAAERLACPACSSTSRAHSLEASVTVRVTATAQLDVVTYPSALLSTSRSLIDAGQYGIGVVVAHMAQALSRTDPGLLTKRGPGGVSGGRSGDELPMDARVILGFGT